METSDSVRRADRRLIVVVLALSVIAASAVALFGRLSLTQLFGPDAGRRPLATRDDDSRGWIESFEATALIKAVLVRSDRLQLLNNPFRDEGRW